MGELLSAIRRNEQITEAMLNRALAYAIRIKTESERESNVPQSLKDHWAKEDAERTLTTDKILKGTSIPESLRQHWRKEDIQRKLEE